MSNMKIANLSLKNRVILAPMAGVTDLPFRIVAREFGCSLAYTEMVNAVGLARNMKKSEGYLDSNAQDKPLGVQLFGTDPDVIADAARMVTQGGADAIDINMGCPVKKVVKTGAGAALLKEPVRIAQIIKAVRAATHVPLTVKIRSGWRRQDINAALVAHIAEENGADAIVVHPRTADQGFSGSADWNVIRQVKESVTIPVIGNGDIWKPEDALHMMEATGCDGVMVGRGTMGNPWLIGGMLAVLEGEEAVGIIGLDERERVILRHLDLDMAYHGEHFSVRSFRKHLLWYTKGLRGGSHFRQLAGTFREKEMVIHELRAFIKGLMDMQDTGK
jgi:tRNA-dihydrouridine synthase B